MLRDARINRIFEGTNEILRLFIALNGIQGPAERLKEIGSALRKPLRNWGLISGYATSRMRAALGATDRVDYPLHPRLETHRRYFERHVAQLKDSVERMIQTHRREIIERQMVLERLADMGIGLVATACVLARTQRLVEERGEGNAERVLELCDLFCVETGKRFKASRQALDSVEEDGRRRGIAAAVRGASGYFVDDAVLEMAREVAAPTAPVTEPSVTGR
ncbi:MAG TPA: hypothetical protein VNA89_15480, partial [Gemmatimonadaceae bacterium]|nr:hypothetical protein [Gemmatimonadaceae bacterium]